VGRRGWVGRAEGGSGGEADGSSTGANREGRHRTPMVPRGQPPVTGGFSHHERAAELAQDGYSRSKEPEERAPHKLHNPGRRCARRCTGNQPHEPSTLGNFVTAEWGDHPGGTGPCSPNGTVKRRDELGMATNPTDQIGSWALGLHALPGEPPPDVPMVEAGPRHEG